MMILVNIWSTKQDKVVFFELISSVNLVFGLPSTIRTCDLRLRRIHGCWKVIIFQWFTQFNRDCAMRFGVL